MLLPTSDQESFLNQLSNPGKNLPSNVEIEQNIQRIVKNIVLSYVSDSAGCGHIRNIFPLSYINAAVSREGQFIPMIAPFFLYQHDILLRTRSIFFQRQMSPSHLPQVRQYKELQKQFNYKMVFDIDDFIWHGENGFEGIPTYNFASTQLGDDVRDASIEIMNMMNVVCVSTEFLKDYLSKKINVPIIVVQNTVPKYFWDKGKRAPIKEKIKKPRIIYSGSPTHYCNQRKLIGDFNNAWLEWVIKNVKDNKIDFLCMGGLPFFFEPIANKIKVVNWVNSYQYHLPIQKFRPDIGIAPLMNNNLFNFSKSDIKYIEYCAVGCVGTGTTFTNGYPSPYDNNVVNKYVQFNDNITVEQIDENISKILEPNIFNSIINEQYDYINKNDRWLESSGYINKMLNIL